MLKCGLALTGVEESEDGTSGTIKFQTPQLDDEDAHSMHMPQGLRCDGCKAIAYQLSTHFSEAEKRRPSKKRLPESELIDITDKVCETSFENYGVKEINKVKRLSGPGLDSADTPGIMQGGGRWPNRLKQMCGDFVGELGEDEIYNAYKNNPVLEQYLCYGDEHLTSLCVKQSDRVNDEL